MHFIQSSAGRSPQHSVSVLIIQRCNACSEFVVFTGTAVEESRRTTLHEAQVDSHAIWAREVEADRPLPIVVLAPLFAGSPSKARTLEGPHHR